MKHTKPLATEKTKAAGVLDAPSTANENTTTKQNTNTKNFSMLVALVEAGKAGINRFQAETKYRDHVLNSTIPILQKIYGIYISRKWEVVPNSFGGTTNCKRYWLDDENKAKAFSIINSAKG